MPWTHPERSGDCRAELTQAHGPALAPHNESLSHHIRSILIVWGNHPAPTGAKKKRHHARTPGRLAQSNLFEIHRYEREPFD